MMTGRLTLIALGFSLAPLLALAHHSAFEYDRNTVVEFTGTIVRLQWQNPHVRFHVRVRSEDGSEKIWETEAMDVNSLDRAGVARDLVEVGQVVTVAGSPSTRRDNALLATNLLLPDGREVLTLLSASPRWTDDALGDRRTVRGRASEYETPVTDIFRTWTTVESNTPSFTADPPLTPAARAAYEAFDPDVDDPVLRCVSPGMPEAMTYIGPHPVGFVELANGDIEIQIESDDNVRVVHMNDDAADGDQPASPLGYSIGRWEGDTLIVTTTRIDWPYFKIFGLIAAPQSGAMQIVERFELERAEGTLTYSFTSTDPTTFTEPVTAEAYHVWRYLPGVHVETYGCTLDAEG